MMILNFLGSLAVMMFVVTCGQSDWPDPREGWARLIGAVIILAAIWF